MPTPKHRRVPIPVDVENVGGIQQAHVEIRPGAINVFTGANGAGKTTLTQAIRRAAGERVPLEVRDGAHLGTVELPGVRVQIKSSIRSTGQAEVSLADTGPLSELIDPGLKGDDERALARVRAMLKLISPTFDATVVATLADGDPDVAAAVEQEVREGALRDLVDVAERVRRVAHAKARDAEALTQQAAGRATSAELTAQQALEKAGGESALVDTPPAEAEQAERAAVETLGRLRHERHVRVELERQQAEVRATLGEAPDPARYDQDLELRSQALAAHEARIRELERAIGQEKEAMAGVRADRDRLLQMRASEEERARKHQRQVALLDQPVTGPAEAEVEAAEAAAARATEHRRSAAVSAEVRSLAATALAARAEADERARRAERLREVATSVYDRLALLPGIADKAAPLTILAGRVHVVDGDQLHDFESRRSAGQKVAAAFALAAKCYAETDDPERAPIVALDGRLWADLDPDAKAEAARAAAELGLAVVTEEPTRGPLGVVHRTGLEPAEVSA